MPGVPPDAVGTLKRALKGLFKRGKKSKDGTSTSSSAYTNQPPQSAADSQASAPRLPPIQNASPMGSATETSKPLPPTHPLATGQHDQRVEAVPQNKEARPGPPAPISPPAQTTYQVQDHQREITSPISPSEPRSTIDGAHEGDVSAITNDASPESPAKVDSGVEEATREESAAQESQHAINNENIQSNTSTTEDSPTSNGTPAPELARTTSGDEKMAVTDEPPPPIKTLKLAPGMSATSGPLEDFPEGGDMRY